jgi:hypothetical protein
MAKPMTRFWLALERPQAPAAVTAEWAGLLREDLGPASHFLAPEQNLATAFPDPNGGPPLAVVEHGSNDFVAVCEEGRRPPIPLRRTDLVIYRVDLRLLIAAVARALGADLDGDPVGGAVRTYRVGRYEPVTRYSFPIIFTAQPTQTGFHATAAAATASVTGPFIFTAPTNHFYREPTERLLRERRSAFLPLADALKYKGHGTYEVDEIGDRELASFRAEVLPADQVCRTYFATPTGCRWADLSVRFVDGETVAVNVGGLAGTFNFTQMGMVDGRSGRPTKQWELLRTFARERGRLTWRSSGADRKNQKRREMLAKDLKAFFRLPGEPIMPIHHPSGWATVFRIVPGD